MPKLAVKGSRELIAKLRKGTKGLKDNVTKTHQNLVRMMFRDLVVHTPQWSGELAMHWGIEFHGMTAPAPGSVTNPGWAARESLPFYAQDPFQMGAEPAVTTTIAREARKIPQIRYNTIVTFTNKMPYASDVERGQTSGPSGVLRDVNRLKGYAGAAMVKYVEFKYSDRAQIRKAIPR